MRIKNWLQDLMEERHALLQENKNLKKLVANMSPWYMGTSQCRICRGIGDHKGDCEFWKVIKEMK